MQQVQQEVLAHVSVQLSGVSKSLGCTASLQQAQQVYGST